LRVLQQIAGTITPKVASQILRHYANEPSNVLNAFKLTREMGIKRAAPLLKHPEFRKLKEEGTRHALEAAGEHDPETVVLTLDHYVNEAVGLPRAIQVTKKHGEEGTRLFAHDEFRGLNRTDTLTALYVAEEGTPKRALEDLMNRRGAFKHIKRHRR